MKKSVQKQVASTTLLDIRRDLKGKIWSHIRQKWLVETPEERVRQEYVCALVNEYEYTTEQMAEEMSRPGVRGTANARADIVVWRSITEKADGENPLIVVECKADNVTIDQATYTQGGNYANFCKARFFVTHNHRQTKYWKVDHSKLAPNYAEIKDIPHAGASEKEINEILASLRTFREDEFADLLHQCHNVIRMEPCERRALALTWDALESWDVKSSRAAAFKLANPSFKPLNEYAEEATELVRPKLEPEKDWPVYGVNNKEGVFFSDYQKGADFNAPYKRIRKGWFFHNPTRSSVGSLGIVPEVPEDAITSPEYQVWRIHNGLLTGFVAVMITTEYFIKLIQFNRVGAVKQRLYVENLLSIPIPEIPEDFQREVAVEREKALAAIVDARAKVAVAAIEVEAMILGTRPVEIPSSSVGRANGC